MAAAAALRRYSSYPASRSLPRGSDLLAGYEEYRRKAAAAAMDYGFHMVVTAWDDKARGVSGTLLAATCIFGRDPLAGCEACRHKGGRRGKRPCQVHHG